MDSRGGGCCIARYGDGRGGGGDGSSNYAKVNRILTRYRPIAPKPVEGGTYMKSSATDITKKESKKSKSGSRKRKVSGKHDPAVVTLQLLPESPELKYSPASGSSSESPEGEDNSVQRGAVWLGLDDKNNNENIRNYHGGDRSGYGVVRSCVKVESLAYMWVGDMNGLGQTDDEKVVRLQKDTCPGFITDGASRVVWVNGAYKEMFGGGGEVAVWMDLRDGVEFGGLSCGGFTCKVRVVTCGEGYGYGKSRSSLTLPCDVWKMDFGGFAWRLDTKAALSLGR